jgi:multiple sugar transport system permease protein
MQRNKSVPFLKEKYQNWIFAYIFLAPLLVGIVLFMLIPIVQSFYYSFTRWNGFNDPVWIGLDNYIRLTTDTMFRSEFVNTFHFVFVSVPIAIIFSLVIANLLNSAIRGRTIFRVIYFLPNVTMAAVVTTMFMLMFHSQYGVVNDIIYFLFRIRPVWLTSPELIMNVVITVSVWSTVGYNIVIVLAALQTVPKSYYEAFEIDGGGPFKKFIYITVPLISPTIFFLLVISIIRAFNSFDFVFMFSMNTGGGPVRDAMRTMVFGIYESGFTNMHFGFASAKSVVMFFIIMTITLIQFVAQKRLVHYK